MSQELKQLIQSKIPGVEFHKPKRVNEAERVSIKSTRDAAIQQAEDADACGSRAVLSFTRSFSFPHFSIASLTEIPAFCVATLCNGYL